MWAQRFHAVEPGRHGRLVLHTSGGSISLEAGRRLALIAVVPLSVASRHALASCAMFLLASGCGDSLPQPTFVRQPTSALVEVPYPPPPARAEFVPPQPRPDAVWIDGEWAWMGRRWAWKYGRWVVPPAGAAFSAWSTARNREATLYFAPGVWRDASGRALPPPKPLALGRASEEDVVDEEGLLEDTGENLVPGRDR